MEPHDRLCVFKCGMSYLVLTVAIFGGIMHAIEALFPKMKPNTRAWQPPHDRTADCEGLWEDDTWLLYPPLNVSHSLPLYLSLARSVIYPSICPFTFIHSLAVICIHHSPSLHPLLKILSLPLSLSLLCVSRQWSSPECPCSADRHGFPLPLPALHALRGALP